MRAKSEFKLHGRSTKHTNRELSKLIFKEKSNQACKKRGSKKCDCSKPRTIFVLYFETVSCTTLNDKRAREKERTMTMMIMMMMMMMMITLLKERAASILASF